MSRLDDIEREAKKRRRVIHEVYERTGWHQHAVAQCEQAEAAVDELVAMVKWWEDANDANNAGMFAFGEGKLTDANPYPKPSTEDRDRRHYEWLSGWEEAACEQERDQARADVKKLRDALITARGFIGDDAPGHPRHRIRDALVETESYESFR